MLISGILIDLYIGFNTFSAYDVRFRLNHTYGIVYLSIYLRLSLRYITSLLYLSTALAIANKLKN